MSDDLKKEESVAEEDTVLDAEVVSEEPSPKIEAQVEQVSEPKKQSATKLGWYVAGGLAVFMAGVYASSYFEAGLVSLGIRTAPPPSVIGTEAFDPAPFEKEIADLKASMSRHQEILAQQQAASEAQLQSQNQLRKDIDLLAGTQNPAATITDGSEIAALKLDVAKLTEDLARLSILNAEADPAVSQLSGALALARAESAQLKERLSALEASLQAFEAGALEATPRGRLVLSLSRMQDRAMAGLSFAAELAGVRSDIAKLPALDQQLMGAELAVLERESTGIQPYANLVRDFDPAVAAALRAGEKEDGSFLSNLFTTRRTDAGATGDDAIIAKAERLLLARDIAGAVEVIATLDGAVADTLTPWRRAAETHVVVSRAFDRLIRAAAQADSLAGDQP